MGPTFWITKLMPILILTRPRSASERFLAIVQDVMGESVKAVVSPLIEIEPSKARFSQKDEGLVLTSENGANAAKRLGFKQGTEAYCVGQRTALVASEAGFVPFSADGDVEDLVTMVDQLRPPMPLVHVRGEHVRGDLCQRLQGRGIECTEVVAYRQVAKPPSQELLAALQGNEPLLVPLFSPRSAMIFGLCEEPTAPIHVIALSAAVAAEVADLGADTVRTVPKPDADAMVAATCHRLIELMDRPIA